MKPGFGINWWTLEQLMMVPPPGRDRKCRIAAWEQTRAPVRLTFRIR